MVSPHQKSRELDAIILAAIASVPGMMLADIWGMIGGNRKAISTRLEFLVRNEKIEVRLSRNKFMYYIFGKVSDSGTGAIVSRLDDDDFPLRQTIRPAKCGEHKFMRCADPFAQAILNVMGVAV